MITPVRTLKVGALCERKDDLLMSVDDVELIAKETRKKAIDEFAKTIKESQQAYIWCCTDSPAEMCDSNCKKCWLKFGKDIDEIAEQLKGGAE